MKCHELEGGLVSSESNYITRLRRARGNPAADIADIEKVEIVFKDGVGYDSERLIQSVQGLVGIR